MGSVSQAGDWQPQLERYRPLVKFWARRQMCPHRVLLRRHVDSSDIAQQTLLTANRSLVSFRGHCEGEFVNWLKAFVSSTVRDEVQKWNRRARIVSIEAPTNGWFYDSAARLLQVLVATTEAPSLKLEREEFDLRLAQALEELPEDEREAIEWRYCEHRTFRYAEIAEFMDRSPSAVKRAIVRGLPKLRRRLKEG